MDCQFLEIALCNLLAASVAGALIFEIPIFYENFGLICILDDFISFEREVRIFGPKNLIDFIP